MWPLESAKTDSAWASMSKSSASSVTAHGSTEKCGCGDHSRSARSSTTTVGAVGEQRLALAGAIDADDVAEAPVVPRLHAGERVLEDRRVLGRDAAGSARPPGRCPAPACR